MPAVTGAAIGIDLGTTYAVMAARTDAGPPQVIPNRHGQRKTRSVVTFTDGRPEVGLDPADCPPGTVVRRIKDFVGDPSRLRRADRSFRPEEIVAMILARLAADAGQALGRAVADAVLTVPATFDAAARRAVRDAAAIAGLRVARIVNEPTAAALAYRPTSPGDAGTVLVYALGGGSFDASVLRLEPAGVEVLATRGDRHLGGWDWDHVLMRLLHQRLTAGRGPDLRRTDADEAYLHGRAERVKRRLSVAARAEAVLRRGGASWQIPVTRAEFEAAAAPLLNRTGSLVRAALADARLTAAGLDRVLLVGEATGMPMVRQLLRRMLEVPLDRSVRPDEAVALGAALLAPAPADPAPAGPAPAGPPANPAGTTGTTGPAADGAAAGAAGDRRDGRDGPAAGPRVRDVATLGLGVLARDAETGELRNVVVVPAGTPLPATGRTAVTTSEDGQTRAVAEVTQGDSPQPDQVRVLGRHVVALPARPAGTRIEIVCAYDADQVPHVQATGVAGGRSTGPVPVPAAGAMTATEVLAAADRLAALLSPVQPAT